MTVKNITLIDRKTNRNLKACHRGAEERFLRERLAHRERSSERKRMGHVGCVVSSPRLQAFRTAATIFRASAGAAQQKNKLQIISGQDAMLGSRLISGRGEFFTPGGVRPSREIVVHDRKRPLADREIVCVKRPVQERCFPQSLNSNHAHTIRGGQQARFNSSAGHSSA